MRDAIMCKCPPKLLLAFLFLLACPSEATCKVAGRHRLSQAQACMWTLRTAQLSGGGGGGSAVQSAWLKWPAAGWKLGVPGAGEATRRQ